MEVLEFPQKCHCGGTSHCIFDTTVYNDWGEWFKAYIHKERTSQIFCNNNHIATYSLLFEIYKKAYPNDNFYSNVKVDDESNMVVKKLPLDCEHCKEPLKAVFNNYIHKSNWDFFKSRSGLSLLCQTCLKINSIQHFRENYLCFKDSKLNEIKNEKKNLVQELKKNNYSIEEKYKEIKILQNKNDLISGRIQHYEKEENHILMELENKNNLHNDIQEQVLKNKISINTNENNNNNNDEINRLRKELEELKKNQNKKKNVCEINDDDDDDDDYMDDDDDTYTEAQTLKEFQRLNKKKLDYLKKIGTDEGVKNNEKTKGKQNLIYAIMKKKGYDLDLLDN